MTIIPLALSEPGEAVQIVIFILPMVMTLGLFAFLSVVGWAVQRRREREAFYRHEVEIKLAERGELSAERLGQIRHDEELVRWRRRREAIKLSGLIALALGCGMVAAIPSTPDGPPRLIGAIPALVGAMMLVYVYVFDPRPPSRTAILIWLALAMGAGWLTGYREFRSSGQLDSTSPAAIQMTAG
jgi:hypothetical protein